MRLVHSYHHAARMPGDAANVFELPAKLLPRAELQLAREGALDKLGSAQKLRGRDHSHPKDREEVNAEP